MIRHIEPPLRLFTGEDSLSRLEAELARKTCRRVAILGGRTVTNSPEIQRVEAACGDRVAVILDGVRAQSPRRAVEHIAETLHSEAIDGVIAIGGGSAMVTARAAVILLAEQRPIGRLCTQPDGTSPRLTAPKIPIVAIPTTPMTAVVKPGSAVLDEDTHKRLSLFDPKTRLEAVFLDTNVLMTAPSRLMRDAGLNTLMSALEALSSPLQDPLAESGLIQSVRRARQTLLNHRDTPTARMDLAMAAILCGRATDHVGMGLATAISHALSTITGCSGAAGKAVMPPHLHEGRCNDGLALALGCDPNDADEAMRTLLAQLRLPRALRDLGIAKDVLPEVATMASNDWFSKAPQDDIAAMLSRAW